MVVGLVAQDCERAIELFDKNQAYQLMWEGHLAERNLLIGPLVDVIRETIRSTNDKHKSLAATRQSSLQPLAIFYRGALGAVLIEQDDVVTSVERGEQRSALGNLLLGLAHVTGPLHVADILYVELHIVLQPLDIFVDALFDKADLGLADYGEGYLHN